MHLPLRGAFANMPERGNLYTILFLLIIGRYENENNDFKQALKWHN
jgi:hypothetical protein